jgi:thioredoxin 1
MVKEPTRSDIDSMVGPVVLEFGAGWCPICQGARPLIDRALSVHPEVRHLWIEDGKGKPLGRSFQVKLWPTLVFLRDGAEVARLVRPTSEAEVASALWGLEAVV